MTNNSPYQEVLLTAAKAAGKIHLKYFRKGDLHPQFKENHHQLVLATDTESQSAIQASLLSEMQALDHNPDEIGFVGEESGLNKPAKFTFIIDPLDGTTNFAFGLDYFCTSIALYKDSQPLAGCTYRATSDTACIAEVGQGARRIDGLMNSESPKEVNLNINHTPLSDSLFATPASYNPEESQRRFRILELMHPLVQNIRIMGATAVDFSLLADNQLQLSVGGAYAWDFAAIDIIVREAGGITTDWEGNPFVINLNEYKKRLHILGCHPQNYEEFIALIRQTA